MFKSILLFFSLLGLQPFLVFGRAAPCPGHPTRTERTCGYQSCPAVYPDKLNIHLVPHTHDDVGWLKTVDQYYFGSRSKIQKAGVQYILDSITQALLDHPDRRFIYVETAFLWKWWLRQDEKVRNDFKRLIDEGRLEMIGGAWSMNDEAVTHYHSTIDQFTWGLRRLNDTFGSCARPRVGWQIDPFGHSREQASLFAQMGFDGMLFGRIDYQDKAKRLEEKSMEFLWKASPNLGDRANLFTAAMFNTYSPPPGFCFDVLCADEPIIDDPESPDYNVNTKINSFLKYVTEQAQHFRTNNVILTMGGDFTYQHAEMWYTNLDKLIRYTNQLNGSTVNVFYSTPSCYLKALHDMNLAWPTKTDDFFPYASDPHAYWTGYFSSRPTIKFFERQGNNLLQISKQLHVLANPKGISDDVDLEHFREAMGIMQHHDAVTGTEKQLVADDYSRILYECMDKAGDMLSKAIRTWEGLDPENKAYPCMDLNISSCAYTENNKKFSVILYNPLSRNVHTPVRLPVQGNSYKVYDGSEMIPSQVVPIPMPVQNLPGRVSQATRELVFRANNVPALGYKTFVVEEVSDDEGIQYNTDSSNTEQRFIGGELYNITVDENGHISVHYNKQKNMEFVQSFHYYEGAEGDNRAFVNRSSGAYIFRPKEPRVKDFSYTGSYQIFKGPVVEEIHQIINNWVSQVVRYYKEEDYVEFDWTVGPIPVNDKIGKEIITKYSSNLESNAEFYTDSNGREMLKRTRNYRPTWHLKLHEPISGNYYPVTSKISLQDQEKSLRLNVLTDRAQGGSSMNDGEIELMLHRRLLKDDAFGVGEALNETAYGEGLVVRGSHYLFGGNTKNLDAFMLREKELTLQLALRPWILIKPINSASEISLNDQSKYSTKSGIAKSLPVNVHILTLEPWKEDTILLRLEHLFEIGEAIQFSQPAEINIQDLFSTFTIQSVQETTLSANQFLQDLNRLKWQADSNDVLNDPEVMLRPVEMANNGAINVLLKPMEIRTFILKVSSSQTL